MAAKIAGAALFAVGLGQSVDGGVVTPIVDAIQRNDINKVRAMLHARLERPVLEKSWELGKDSGLAFSCSEGDQMSRSVMLLSHSRL